MIDVVPVLPAVLEHARQSPAREVCGFLVVPHGFLKFMPCRNIAGDDQEFEIHPEDVIAAEGEGAVAVVHSHTHASPEPSMADRVGCERSGLPWLIVSAMTGAYKVIEPEGYEAPLIGRPFVHGVFDCYSLARDWYRKERGIDVLDFERSPNWWETAADLLTPENFAKAGFAIVTDGSLQEGDVFIMQNGRTDKPNHVGVYVGDGLFLHHAGGRLSCREPYGGYWQKVTRWIVRRAC